MNFYLHLTQQSIYIHNRSFADPNLLLIAEIHKKPAGMCITLPNYKAYSPKSCRVAVLAVVPEFRHKGIAALLMYKTALKLIKNGYKKAKAIVNT